jgi:FkbM family methyltransferase
MLTVHRRALSRLRERLHPLEQIKRTSLGQRMLPAIDRPIWAKLPNISHDRVRVRSLSHASYYLTAEGPEPELTATFAHLVGSRPIHTFVDVGANLGLYTWAFLNWNPNGKVIAIEPDPASLELFRDTASRWGRSVELHPVALFDDEGVRNLTLDRTGGHRSSLVADRCGEEVPVRTRRLDDVVRGRRVDLVKIDVEGAEMQVLVGARQTIRNSRPCFIVECFHRPPTCLQPLRQLGYEILDGERGGTAVDHTTNYLALSTLGEP